MKQIQKCPHCHRDAVFTREICPNCGYTSKYEDRGEPDYKADEANKRIPSYAAIMEEHMTVAQRHGRILLGLVMGLIGAPLLAWGIVNVYLLMDPNLTMEIPLFRVFLCCVALGWMDWEIWHSGRKWLVRGLMMIAFFGGLFMLGRACFLLFNKDFDNPVLLLGFLVFGVVYLWCAWQLFRSKDIPEFLRMQRQKAKDEEIS